MSCKPTTLASRYASLALQRGDVAFNRGILAFDYITEVQNPISKYTYAEKTELLGITRDLNLLRGTPILANYEWANSRFEQGPVSIVEVSDFLDQSGYTLASMGQILQITPFVNTNTQISDFLNQLDFYYTENLASSISGRTCGALSNPFSKLFELIEKFQNAMDLIQNLANFDFASLIGPLGSIEQILMQIVERLKETLLQRVNNMVGQISGLVQLVSGGPAGVQVLTQFRRMVNNVRDFLSDLSVETIQERIRQLLASAVTQFQEITPEILLFLLFRFCQLAEFLQAFMQGPVDLLGERVNGFSTNARLLTQMGMDVTREVVDNGGRRLRTRGITDARGRMTDLANGDTGGGGGGAGGAGGAGGGGGAIDLVDDGRPRAQPGLQIPAYVRNGTISQEQANAIMQLSENGIPGYVNPFNRDDVYFPDSYLRVVDEVWVRLIKALDMCPENTKPISIGSLWRGRPVNNVRGSYHMTGEALDIGFQRNTRAFLAACSIQGFGAIQTYSDGFTHIDIGPKRHWNSYGAHGLGGPYSDILRAHMNGDTASITRILQEEGGTLTPDPGTSDVDPFRSGPF